MKTAIKKALRGMGYKIVKDQEPQASTFTVGELNFVADPCSVGLTPQGELTARGAIRMIRERGLSELKVLDICCGVGIIGLTMFNTLRRESTIRETVLADINIFNLNSLRKTLKANNLEHKVGDEIRFYLTDGLGGVPSSEKFDIIVSNPPHFFAGAFREQQSALTPHVLGTYDAGWDFHRAFYEVCHNYLTDRGEVWFLENAEAATESDLLPFIQSNERLKYMLQTEEPLLPGFFWMFSRLNR